MAKKRRVVRSKKRRKSKSLLWNSIDGKLLHPDSRAQKEYERLWDSMIKRGVIV